MAYKAEHAVDLDTDIVVAVNVQLGNALDTATVIDTAIDAAGNAEKAGGENEVQAIVANKGYHSTKVVTIASELGMLAYISEGASPKQRRWSDKESGTEAGRVRRAKSHAELAWQAPPPGFEAN